LRGRPGPWPAEQYLHQALAGRSSQVHSDNLWYSCWPLVIDSDCPLPLSKCRCVPPKVGKGSVLLELFMGDFRAYKFEDGIHSKRSLRKLYWSLRLTDFSHKRSVANITTCTFYLFFLTWWHRLARRIESIPCLTEHPSLAAFPIWDIAKQFYISARIQTNFRDDFTNLML
jgi:hypothetical protein